MAEPGDVRTELGFRVGFVTGVTPDKWARTWRERRRSSALVLVPLDSASAESAVRRGEVDMGLLRLPVRRDGLHAITLYRELPVVVVGLDNPIAAYDEIGLAELTDEQFVLGPPSGFEPSAEQLEFAPMGQEEAVEVAAAGTGVVVLPMSVARLHHRRDVVAVPLTDVPETEIALVWRMDRDDEQTQEFAGVVRGRTSRSSR